MTERRINVISRIIGAFQKKKYVYDDIVAAADKVVEDYIFTKNKLIRKSCLAKRKKPDPAVPLLCAIVLGTAAVLFLLISLL